MAERVVGRSVPRPDARAKLTGALVYASDWSAPGMLVGAVLRSTVARGRIRAIDVGPARALPGVAAALAAADLGPEVPRFGPLQRDQPALADGEIRFHGEPVAAVAAEDEATARAALAAVRVDVDPLPAVACLDDALAPGAPAASPGGTLLHESRFAWGELGDQGAGLVLDRTYESPPVQHVSLEPHACVASWEAGGLTVWGGIQHPYHLRRILAEAFGLALARVRVVALPMGGAFGGKGYPKVEPVAALLSRAAGRPVGLRLSLGESFHSARAAGARVRMRTTLGHDGRLRSQEVWADFLAGAYADMAPRVVAKSAYLACGPYRTPAARITARAIASNTTPSTAFRGFGAPQVTWALECQIDELAALAGEDPVAFRLRNLCGPDDPPVPGDTPRDGDWPEALTRVAEAIGHDRPRPAGRGVGVALAIKAPIAGSSSAAIVRLHADASATVQLGTTEIGQGSRVAMAQIAAEALGIAVADVAVPDPDTATAPFDLATASSRSTTLTGRALEAACADVRAQLAQLAAEALGAPAEVGAGSVVAADGRRLAYAELLAAIFGPGQGEIVGRGTYRGARADMPLDGPAPFWEVCASGSEVEVDPATGGLRVLRHVVVSDVGRAINPLAVEGQDAGAAVMGLGRALAEELAYDDAGRLRTADLEAYRIPGTHDAPPELASILIENGDGPGPFGAKGVGESGIMAAAPSVANALFDATGVRVRRLPLTPERVWRALREPPSATREDRMTTEPSDADDARLPPAAATRDGAS